MTPSKFAVDVTDRVTYILLAERKRQREREKITSCNACNVHLAFRTCYMDPELHT
jgi:hypothetical protein